MTDQEQWEARVAAVSKDIDGFEVGYKDQDALQKAITAVMFWTDYSKFISTLAPKVFFANEEYVTTNWPWKTLEHEWVHLKDADTFFELLPWLPRWINRKVFGMAYLFPQILGLGALGAIGAIWFLPLLGFLGFLIFLAPWPAPFRAWAEIRAYRRSVELWPDRREQRIGAYIPHFTGPNYYYMWPFKRKVREWLSSGPSPYQEMMDGLDQ